MKDEFIWFLNCWAFMHNILFLSAFFPPFFSFVFFATLHHITGSGNFAVICVFVFLGQMHYFDKFWDFLEILAYELYCLLLSKSAWNLPNVNEMYHPNIEIMCFFSLSLFCSFLFLLWKSSCYRAGIKWCLYSG